MSRLDSSMSHDVIDSTDANLSSYAVSAGRLAHSRGLEQRGAVMKTQNGVLVVERRDGTVQILRKLPAERVVPAGTVLKRAR